MSQLGSKLKKHKDLFKNYFWILKYYSFLLEVRRPNSLDPFAYQAACSPAWRCYAVSKHVIVSCKGPIVFIIPCRVWDLLTLAWPFIIGKFMSYLTSVFNICCCTRYLTTNLIFLQGRGDCLHTQSHPFLSASREEKVGPEALKLAWLCSRSCKLLSSGHCNSCSCFRALFLLFFLLFP